MKYVGNSIRPVRHWGFEKNNVHDVRHDMKWHDGMKSMFGISVEVLERIHGLSPSSILKTDEKYFLKVLAIFSRFRVRPPLGRATSETPDFMCIFVFTYLKNWPMFPHLSSWSLFDLKYSFINVMHLLANLKYKFLLASLVFVLQSLQSLEFVLSNLLMKKG